MAKRIVGWLVLIPLCAIIIVFALANRHAVAVNFNPLVSADAVDAAYGVPLFLVIYAILFLGIALGGTAVWFTQSVHRKAAKRYRRENQKLKSELEAARRAPAREADPALAAADELA